MPRGGSKPGERRGGRKKGTPNKLTAQLQAPLAQAARRYDGNALQTLVAIRLELANVANNSQYQVADRPLTATG